MAVEKKEKLRVLQQLSEDKLRKEVLVPLFEKMGFQDVIEYHGPAEKGKDIIFYETDKFHSKIYTGVVVKIESISGSVSKPGGAMVIINQILQTFNEPYNDIYGLKKCVIDRCIVVTSKDIKNTAVESIKGTLEKFHLDKLVNFFDGSKLVDLLDEHMPGYFFKEFEGFNNCFNAMKKDFETIRDVSAIGQKQAVPLEDIYVSLKLSEETAERSMPRMPMEMQEKIFDEKALELMEKERERKIERRRIIDPGKAVDQFHRMVILGAPGAGKTTLLKHLALKACKENIEKQERIRVPIPITLREFFESNKRLRQYMDSVFEKYGFPEAKQLVEKDLKAGKCFLLLDGFDELAETKNQEKVAKEIHDFVDTYHTCRVVVTSRIAGYHDELPGFTRLEVMPFDRDQIKQFIENWFGKSASSRAASMSKAVMENDNIRALAQNPLMIAIIAVIYEEDRELPQRRADLYKRAVEVLLSRWDVHKRLKNHFPSEKKEFILKKLAFLCHCRNHRTISEKEILKEIKKYSSKIGLKKEDAKPFLEETWQRSYLLRQIAMDTYDFLHLSFQEYFTALELKEQEDGIGTIIKHISEPWWEEPILLYAGISRDAGPLIKRIDKEVKEDIFYSNLMLFGKCIADAQFTDEALKHDIAEKIWSIYKRPEFDLLRLKARVVLRRLKPDHIIDRLIKQLTAKDSSVRTSVAYVLGDLGSESALDPLIQALAHDKDSLVRMRAAEALCVLGNESALDTFLQALTQDKDSGVRTIAASALGMLGSESALDPLIQALTQNKDSGVRAIAASALGMLGSKSALDPLIQALAEDRDSIVRAIAASALGMLGSESALDPLIQALKQDKDSLVRHGAVHALGALGNPSVLDPLIQAFTQDKDSLVRQGAAKCLGAFGSESALDPLIQAFTQDKDSLVRRSVAEGLGAFGSESALEPLIQALIQDKNRFVRRSAAEGLGSLGSESALDPLIHALTKDEDSGVRMSASSALGTLGSESALAPLIQTLTQDKDSNVRRDAASALGKIGEHTTIQPLKRALEDEGLGVRDAAFEALEKVSKREGVRVFKD